ncbi:hypothetical protein ACSBR2_019579 [Camellia fascicularis]
MTDVQCNNFAGSLSAYVAYPSLATCLSVIGSSCHVEFQQRWAQALPALVQGRPVAMPVFCSIAEDPNEVEQWFHDLTTKADQKLTKLHFHFQDLRGITTTIVAQSNTRLTSPTFFGLITWWTIH